MKKYLEDIKVVAQIADKDNTFILNKDVTEVDGYSAVIVKNKYAKKEKYQKYDWVCLKQSQIEKIINWDFNESLYLRCSCFCEILLIERVDEDVIVSVWDNCYLKHKKYLDIAMSTPVTNFKELIKSVEDFVHGQTV